MYGVTGVMRGVDCKACSVDIRLDLICYVCVLFVGPKAENDPTSMFECCGCLDVARDISIDLWPPVFNIRFGLGVVLGTLVPKASVNEDCQLCCGEEDVGRSPQLRKWSR